jgi:hypothetical protein
MRSTNGHGYKYRVPRKYIFAIRCLRFFFWINLNLARLRRHEIPHTFNERVIFFHDVYKHILLILNLNVEYWIMNA